MRDPSRIYGVINDIMHEWEKYPDLRLGQMISSAMHGCGVDLFYIEDEELVDVIKKHFKGVERYGNKNST